MHNYRLITLLNSIGLAAARIGRNAAVVMFLFFCAGASANCSENVFPTTASEWLLPSADKPLALGQHKNSSLAACGYSNVDLAQWHFWGVGKQVADIELAYRHAKNAVSQDRWPYELALIHAAFVIKGLDNGISLHEAVRRFRREILSGNPLRRDKALATLNQLSAFLPHVKTVAAAVFADSQLREPVVLSPTMAVQLSRRGNTRVIMLSDGAGAPTLYWTDKVVAADESRYLVFQRHSSVGASGEEDVRQQLWRLPASMPRSGILLSRFIRADGSPYQSQCTATQLAPQWLISASHCLFTPEGSGQLKSVQFIVDPLVRSTPVTGSVSNGVGTTVTAVWRHYQHHPEDQYNGELGRYSGSDIALFKLLSPIRLDNPPILAEPNPQNRWVESLSYPKDKTPYSLWASRCRSNLWEQGTEDLSDLYVLDCFSYAGQSGTVLTQGNADERQIVGILSARIYNNSINRPVFAGLKPGLIKEIKAMMTGKRSALFIAMPMISPASLAVVKP